MKPILWRIYWHWLRWPMPLWRLRRRASVTVGGHRFRFEGVRGTPYLSWLQAARLNIDEPLVTRYLTDHLRPGDTYADVGSYVGGYVLLASRLVGPHGRVLAFEPDPATRGILRRNLQANGASNVDVVPAAVAGHVGTLDLDARGDATSTVVGYESGSVDALTLDHACSLLDARPGIVKMDIEGGESSAVAEGAADRTISQARAFVLEVHEFADVDFDRIRLSVATWGKHPTSLDSRSASNYNVVFE